jgi:hypothetical protein
MSYGYVAIVLMTAKVSKFCLKNEEALWRLEKIRHIESLDGFTVAVAVAVAVAIELYFEMKMKAMKE